MTAARRPRLERHHDHTVLVGGPVPRGSSGITLGRLVILRRDAADSAYLRRHELAHVRQYAEHGVVGFAARYVGDYVRGRLRRYPHRRAYLRIGFEVAADWEARRSLGMGVVDEGSRLPA
jgi:hypothetical protein